jgi:probable phosphoglycerate mutase
MTLCLLVRHAEHDLVGRVLVGRGDGVPINGAGKEQVVELMQRLSALGVTHIQSSPRVRALQTAAQIAKHLGLTVELGGALDEVDFGCWTGRWLRDLECDAAWHTWNETREQARAPGGESMADVQARIVTHLQRMQMERPGARIVMVSHAEPIRAAVLHCTSQPLGAWASLDVPCASVTAIEDLSCGYRLVDLGELAAA